MPHYENNTFCTRVVFLHCVTISFQEEYCHSVVTTLYLPHCRNNNYLPIGILLHCEHNTEHPGGILPHYLPGEILPQSGHKTYLPRDLATMLIQHLPSKRDLAKLWKQHLPSRRYLATLWTQHSPVRMDLATFWTQHLPSRRDLATLWTSLLIACHFPHLNQSAVQAGQIVGCAKKRWINLNINILTSLKYCTVYMYSYDNISNSQPGPLSSWSICI
jgi:hypothetical protein